MFHDKVVIGYVPVFKDGWIPPEIVADEREAAAAKSTAVMVAKMKVSLHLLTSFYAFLSERIISLCSLRHKTELRRVSYVCYRQNHNSPYHSYQD